MEDIKEIVLRSVDSSGVIHYTLEEKISVIRAYIKSRKGVEPPEFGIGRGMMEAQLLSIAFDTALWWFADKFRKDEGEL